MAYMRNEMRFVLLGAVILVTAGCTRPHQGWEPPIEVTSTRVLQEQVTEALQLVRTARGDAGGDPEQVPLLLDEAVRALERMSDYYLPLLEARERTYNAHRFLYYGEGKRANSEIEAVEELLDTIVMSAGAKLQPVMKEPLDLVSEARAAVMAGSKNAPDLIEKLETKLNLMLLKGRLELPHDS